jgi:hypothetical protein
VTSLRCSVAAWAPIVSIAQTTSSSLSTLLTSPAGAFTAGWVIFGGILKVFKEVEDHLSADGKQTIAIWLLYAPEASVKHAENWPRTFSKIFDRTFGEHAISPTRFYRSFVMAAVTTLAVFAIWGLVHFGQFRSYWRATPYPFVEYLVPLIAVGWPTTYISVLKSGWLLRWLARRKLQTRGIVIVFADVLITVAIALAAYRFYAFLSHELRESLHASGHGWLIQQIVGQRSGTTVADDLLPSTFMTFDLNAKPGYAPLIAILYASYFTSAWALTYAVAGLLLRTASRLQGPFSALVSWLDIENKPVRAIGIVVASLTMVCFWMTEFVRRLAT